MNEPIKIKSIYLPLFDYKFAHGSIEVIKNNIDDQFVGRRYIIKKLKLLIDNKFSSTKRGAYLIAGYRGMGKTSLVKKAISECSTENIEEFHIALSQGDVNELELLRQIASSLNIFVNTSIVGKHTRRKLSKTASSTSLALIFIILFVLQSIILPQYDANDLPHIIMFFVIWLLLFSLTRNILTWFLNIRLKHHQINYGKSIVKTNSILQSRLYSSYSIENQPPSGFSIGTENPISNIGNFLISILQGGGNSEVNRTDYDIAKPKEIEHYIKNLLKSLNLLRDFCDSHSTHNRVPNFIFVIDELDKIEPDYVNFLSKIKQDYQSNSATRDYHISAWRSRGLVMSKLLANLKNFLNTAHAKFIFIGGREMYDAALADVADRESFFSSIFNEVIYVPSFFKDKLTTQSGVTQLTESYLCRLLFDDNKRKTLGYLQERYSIKNLYDYYVVEHQNILNSKESQLKLLHTLQNLVIFLTYRSNGSPKKLMELIDGMVEQLDISMPAIRKKLTQNHLVLIPQVDESSGSGHMFLKISFRKQYQINLHANIYRPYLIINSKHLKALGDKLLYSSAFIIDHILKFHKSSFSWRNLEHVPDIILANKDPNFRKYHTELMSFLLKQHLRRTVNSIYQYKFNSKIAGELRYSSKISESSSAAFNFTLDESLHLKTHYEMELKKIKAMNSMGNAGSNHNEALIHSILGDLYFYDEQFDDAIIHFTHCVDKLTPTHNVHEKSSMYGLTLLTRSQLSLGLCYEKRRMFDNAYMAYSTLVHDIRNIFSAYQSSQESTIWETPYKHLSLLQKPALALLAIADKGRQDGITYDNLERNFEEYISFLNLSIQKDILFPINREGRYLSKVNYDEIKAQSYELKEENYIPKELRTDKKRIVTLLADYYYSVGSILFFKNQIFYKLLYSRHKHDNSYHPTDEVLSKQVIKQIHLKTTTYQPSQSAYLYYLHALSMFNCPYRENIERLKFGNGLEEKVDYLYFKNNQKITLSDEIKFCINYLSEDVYGILNADQNDFLGNILGKMADAILASIGNTQAKNPALSTVSLFKQANFSHSERNHIMSHLFDPINLDSVFIIQRLSYHFYLKAGKRYSAIFQYKKMLYVLRDKVDGANAIQLTEELLNSIFAIPLNSLSLINETASRSQLSKYRIVTNSKSGYTSFLYNNLSTSPEVKEWILLGESIKIKSKLITESTFYIGSHSTISSIFTRIIELKFAAERYFRILSKDKNMDDLYQLEINLSSDLTKFKDVFIPSLANGFTALNEIYRSLNAYGVSYVFNYSFLAAICERLGKMCLLIEVCKTIEKKNGTNYLLQKLEQMQGPNISLALDPYEHLEKAVLCYQLSLQTHTEGTSYKEMSKDLFFLEDDLNDNLVHFCASIERYRINSGRIDKKIEDINKLLRTSKLVKYEAYV